MTLLTLAAAIPLTAIAAWAVGVHLRMAARCLEARLRRRRLALGVS